MNRGASPPSGNPQVTSRLWPVLLILVLLPLTAKLVEAWASSRASDTIVIRVDAHSQSTEDAANDTTSFAEAPVDDEHRKARELVRRGQLADGLVLFEKCAASHADNAQLAVEYGFWLLNAYKQEEALAALHRAKELAPNDSRVALHLGRALRRGNDLAAAEAELRRALALRPSYSAALFALGGTLLDARRAEEARAVLERASTSGSNEDRARGYAQLGRAFLALKKPEEAEAAFTSAIERAPARVEVRLDIARAYLDAEDGGKENTARASAVLATATDLAPDLPDVWIVVGRVREAQDETAAAAEAYQRAIQLDPKNAFARRKLLRLALEDRHYARARAQAQQLLADDADDPEHHFLFGLVAARDGKLDEARAHYKTAIEKSKKSYPEAWYNLGLLERDAENLEGAVTAYRKAIELRPGYNAAENNLGLALVDAGKVDDAESVYKALLARAPRYTAAWINLGKLYSGKKAYAQAVEAYNKALDTKPDYPRALLDLGVAYARMGKTADAVATYKRLLEKNERSVSGWYNLGIALDAMGNAAEATSAWNKALELDPDHVPSLKRRAGAEAAQNHLDEAGRLYGDALDLRVTDHEARLGLADVKRRSGDAAACQREVQLVLRDDPQDKKAAALLPRCHGSR